MRRKIIAGNWKMNCTVEETVSLLKELSAADMGKVACDVVVCPPFTSLNAAANQLRGSKIALGAQDMSEHKSGAYTGEISAEMLLTLGVSHVILGHSERRQYHFETDDRVNRAAQVAIAAGLTPIICVGETLEQREADKTDEVIGKQVQGVLAGFDKELLSRTVIAYEPVWAIGTGKTATPEMAEQVHRFIRQKMSDIDVDVAQTVPILYGGSVKPGNAEGLLSQPDIDGALVGGASLKAGDFVGIINAV